MWLSSTCIVLFIFCALLQGCTPSHSTEKSELYARKLGVINQFEISRWHGRTLPAASRILVATNAVKPVDAKALSAVLAQGLAPFFSHTSAAQKQQSAATATAVALQKKCNFLFYIELIDSKPTLIFTDRDQPPDNDSIPYKQMQLLIVVVDVVSGQTIDKIKLSANTAHFNFWGTDMPSLLAKPIATIGRDLTGA